MYDNAVLGCGTCDFDCRFRVSRLPGNFKERACPELTRAARCRLVVLGLEVGGRWSSEAATFVRLLARAKARSFPPPSRPFVAAAWERRCGLLAFAAQRAFSASLFTLPAGSGAHVDGAAPLLSDLVVPPAERPSRLGP
ncbi:Trypsin-2, partial [Durusdinium trenchii]